MRLVFGSFLIVHGLIHVLWFVPKPRTPDGPPWPFGLTDSWLLNGVHAPDGLVRGVAVTLALASLAGFVLAGLGVIGVPGLNHAWSGLTIGSAAASLLLVVLFWHTFFVVGLVLDIALLVTTIGGRWPSTLVA